MMSKLICALVVGCMLLSSDIVFGQFDILDFDDTAQGPWSDIENTTLTVPQVADGSVTLDGKPGNAEYGGFEGVKVTPGDNAWILSFPDDRQWDGPEDSSFTFWLAHDTDYLYVGVDAQDDFVNSDDTNAAFWKDDAIEIVTDVWNNNYDNNTDNSMDLYGGHSYVNFEGRFSRWDDELGEIQGTTWATDVVDWTYGVVDAEDTDISGFGEETDTGWNMEVRLHKRLFEDPEAEIKLVEGAKMGFNIGMDDDDMFGPGTEGDGSRSQDLELQYFWANRQRFLGWDESQDDGFFTEEEIADSFERLGNNDPDLGALGFDYDVGIDGAGRLSHGGTGEIIFGGLSALPGDCNGDSVVDVLDANCTPASELDAFLEGAGLIKGDADGDDQVQFSDFVILADNFGLPGEYTNGDFDKDSTVQFGDFVILADHFGQVAASAGQAVPEPSSLALFGIGVLLASLVRRRCRDQEK